MGKGINPLWLLAGFTLLVSGARNSALAGIGAIKKTKWFAPYNNEGKTNLRFTADKTGVYFIKENGKIVYVGYSGFNLYRTLYRHFQQWNNRQSETLTYVNKLSRNDYKVRVILCTAAQAVKIEKAYINKYKPRDNKAGIELDFVPDTTTEKLIFAVNDAEEVLPF